MLACAKNAYAHIVTASIQGVFKQRRLATLNSISRWHCFWIHIFADLRRHVPAERDQQWHPVSVRGEPRHHQRDAKRGSAGLPQEPSKIPKPSNVFFVVRDILNHLFFGEDLKITIPTFHSLCTGPAEPEIQDAWLGPCAAELHALPYYGEF